MESHDILKDYKDYVQQITKKRIQIVERIGGLTNINYMLESEDGEKFIMKILSKQLETFIDRDLESSIILRLSSLKLYPIIIRIERNFRLEKFIRSTKICKPEFYKSKLLRDQMAQLIYNTQITLGSLFNRDEYTVLENKLLSFVSNYQDITQGILRRIKHRIPENDFEAFNVLTEDLQQNVEQLPSILKGLEIFESIAHNDINFGNCLRLEQDEMFEHPWGDILLLDYEYSGKSYLLFDIANFLHSQRCRIIEGGAFDLLDYPHVKKDDSKSASEMEAIERSFLLEFKKLFDIESPISKISDNEYLRLISLFKSIAYLYWATLGIASSDNAGLDFDFVSYSRIKSESFKHYLNKFLFEE